LHSNKQPWKKQANFANPKNWVCGGKTSDKGARGNYKGKAEISTRTTTNASKPIM